MINRSPNKAGFTLLEMAISITLMGIIGGAVGMFVKSSLESHQTTTASLESDTSSRRAMAQVKRLLRPAVFSSMTPRLEGEFFSSSIDFQRDTTGTGVLDPLERIEWRIAANELNDGIDNNGNGMIDEGRLVWIERVNEPDAQLHVLKRNVSEFMFQETPNGLDDNGNGMRDETGICFNFSGRTLRIQMTVEGRGANGALFQSTFESRIHVRN